MTIPQTPLAVVQGLSALTVKLYRHVGAYSDAEKVAAQLRAAADVAESRAFIAAEGAMDLRKHVAKVKVYDLELEAAVAEAVVKTYRAKIKALEIDIEVHRTYGTTLRAELAISGYDPHP